MDFNFQIKKFTGTVLFQSKLKILNRITECYNGYVKLVDDLTSAKQVLSLLKCQDVLAFDCEGVKLGRGGKMTLIQIGVKNGTVYLFDVLDLRRIYFWKVPPFISTCTIANVIQILYTMNSV